jgi:hypothetical protein
MVFLWDEPMGWRLAQGGECSTSWRTVAQGRGEAVERDDVMQRRQRRECGGTTVVVALLRCNGGGAGRRNAEAAVQDGDEGGS